MAEFALASASTKQLWRKQYVREYIRRSGYADYMSMSGDPSKTGVIITKLDELQRESGQTINIPFIGRITAGGVTGSTVLEGNETTLSNFNCPISIDWRRQAVVVPKSESYKTEIDVLNAAKLQLQDWESEQVRDDITNALGSFVTDAAGGVTLAINSTAANRNTFLANNSDRVLFGTTKSNYSATWATAIANVTAAMKASAAMMSLAKRIAKLSDPHIRPYKTATGREFFLAFHGSRTFRDLKADATIVSANTNARAREAGGMNDNPIFQDGDIIYDGVIHHEVPEIDAWATASGIFDAAGGSSADVRPIFVCGTGAVGIAWGQMPRLIANKLRDYEFRPGVALEELLGVKKLNFNGKQLGVVSVFAGAAADS